MNGFDSVIASIAAKTKPSETEYRDEDGTYRNLVFPYVLHVVKEGAIQLAPSIIGCL